MTSSMYDKPQVGNLVMDDHKALGIVTLIETTFYFVCWQSGDIMGYTTAHKLKEIERWSKNVRPNT